MLKSIQDLNEQAERIITMAYGTTHFVACNGGVSASTIYRMRTRMRVARGFDLFGDYGNEKRELTGYKPSAMAQVFVNKQPVQLTLF